MKISKTICAAIVTLLLVLQNFVPMVPVIADTVESGETKATVETEAPKETKKAAETSKPKETKKQAETKATSETTAVKTAEKTEEITKPTETKKSVETKATEKVVETTKASETKKATDEKKPIETEATSGTTVPNETEKALEPTESAETAKPNETTETAKETEPVESAKPSETTTEETKKTEATEPSETSEAVETTEPSETETTSESTEPSESEKEATEPTESTETSETTDVEEEKIVKAKDADEYIKLVVALPDGDKLIVETKSDLSVLNPGAGVYFDGVYTLWFETTAAYDAAVKYVASKGYKYTEDGVIGLCGNGDYSAEISRAVKTDAASSSGKTRVVIIDTGVNGADEAYSVIGTDVKDKNGHGTEMASLIEESTKKAYIISVKAIGDNGKGNVSDVYAAIQYATELNPDIILMAISIKDKPDEYAALRSLIEETASKTILIASAGNNNSDASKYLPAGGKGVKTIGAVTGSYYKTSTSNYGDTVDYYVVASSTSEAAASFVGKYIAKDDSGVVISYIGSENGLEYIGDDIFFGVDSDFTDNTKKILDKRDLNNRTKEAFHQDVLKYAKEICDNNNYTYSLDGGTYKLDCVGFVNKVYYLALGKPAFKSGTSYYEAKYTYETKSGKKYRARIFDGNTAPGCSAWINYAGIRTKPSASSKAKKASTLSTAAKHINKYAEPGDIIMYGSSDKWVHAAIYAGSADGGSTYYEYGAHGSTLATEDQISRIKKSAKTFVGSEGGSVSYVLVVRVTGGSTRPLTFEKKTVGDETALGECYSFEGTTYGVYTDAACTTPYAAYPEIIFDESGSPETDCPDIQNYPLTVYLKETAAGPGYLLDDSIYKLTLTSATAGTITTVEGDGHAKVTVSGANFTVTLYDEPAFDPLSIQLQKTGVNNAAAASMNKVTYRIRYYDGNYDVDPAKFTPNDFDDPTNGVTPTDDFYVTVSNPNQLHQFTLKEFAGYSSNVTVSGDNDFLKAIYDSGLTDGRESPFGTYRICEYTAPDGYYVNETVYRIKLFMDTDGDKDCEARNETTGKLISEVLIDNEPGFDIKISEIPAPTFLTLEKNVADDSSLSGFKFEIYSGTTLFATGTSEDDGRVKWTYKLADYYSTNLDPDHPALTTLLTGTTTYKLELPSKAEFQIREIFSSGSKYLWKVPDSWSDGGTYFYKDITSGDELAETPMTVTNKPAYKTYSLEKEVKASDGTVSKAGFVFSVVDETGKVYANGVSLESGKVQWTYAIGGEIAGIAATKAGTKTEKLIIMDVRADGTSIKYQVREDMNAAAQKRGMPINWSEGSTYFYKEIDTTSDIISDTVVNYIPKLKTKATTAAGNIVEYSKQAVITDTVSYSNLVPGKEYTITGKLVVKSTGKTVKGDDGKDLISSVTFTPTSSDGTVDVVFTFNSTLYQGETVVAFETLTHNGIEYAVHADINDEDQSSDVPGIKTKASAAAGNVVEYSKTATITDTVTYKNLDPTKSYKLSGKLIIKRTGEPVKDDKGNDIVAEVDFTPADRNGTQDVTFTFDSTLLQGEKLVVFETLTSNDIVYAVHTDIDDEAQTVYVPEIHTTATDKNKRKEFRANQKAVIVDEVSYKNLEPGRKYRVEGVLYDKSTGAPIFVNGKTVTASTTFTAKNRNGTVKVTFKFDARGLAEYDKNNKLKSKEVVVFEKVSDITSTATLVAVHEDINDKDQTVKLTEYKTADNTGYDNILTGYFISAITASTAGIAWLIFNRKKKKEEGNI